MYSDKAKQLRGQLLQAKYLASFSGQSGSRQLIGYSFYIPSYHRPSLYIMDDYGTCIKLPLTPYYLTEGCRAAH